MRINIRKFKGDDYEWINSFEKNLILKKNVDLSGFIISPLSLDVIEDLTSNGICLVAETNNLPVGVLASGPSTCKSLSYLHDDLLKVEWNNHTHLNIKEIFWLERISIASNVQNMGIGSKLLTELFKLKGNQSIYSAVVTRPVNNIIAKQFYSKSGFIEVGKYSNPEFRGMKNYESSILLREGVS